MFMADHDLVVGLQPSLRKACVEELLDTYEINHEYYNCVEAWKVGVWSNIQQGNGLVISS